MPQPTPATKQELQAKLNSMSVVRDTGQVTPQRDGSVRHVARITWVENDPVTNHPIAKSLEDSIPVEPGKTQAHPSEVTRLMARLEAKFEEYKDEIIEFFFPSKATAAPPPIVANNVAAADGSPLPDTQTQDEAHAAADETKAQTEAGQAAAEPVASPANESAPATTPAPAGSDVPPAGSGAGVGTVRPEGPAAAGIAAGDTGGPRGADVKQSGAESLSGS